jgi:sarcosine oxidase subunit delta
MLLIACPWCGPRDEIEFRCGGESHIARPGPEVSDQVWAEYLFYRANPKGAHRERWLHAAGCRRWFNLVRDTVTHEITAVYRMGESGPAEPPAAAPSRASGAGR